MFSEAINRKNSHLALQNPVSSSAPTKHPLLTYAAAVARGVLFHLIGPKPQWNWPSSLAEPTSCWLNQPLGKILYRQNGSFPPRVNNKNIFETTTYLITKNMWLLVVIMWLKVLLQCHFWEITEGVYASVLSYGLIKHTLRSQTFLEQKSSNLQITQDVWSGTTQRIKIIPFPKCPKETWATSSCVRWFGASVLQHLQSPF